ncbi:MAG: twin-arginine translocase TatA/TatE family subunit [Solirubrobacteraceae bacterium]
MFRNPSTDLIVVLLIVLLILGPKRLPGLGKSLGQGMREFKEGITGESKDEEQKPAITQASTLPDPTVSRPAEQAPAPNPGPAAEHRS